MPAGRRGRRHTRVAAQRGNQTDSSITQAPPTPARQRGRSYVRSAVTLESEHNVIVKEAGGDLLLVIPMAFLQSSFGTSAVWSTVQYLAYVVREVTDHRAPCFLLAGRLQAPSDTLQEGEYQLVNASQEPLNAEHKPGPYGKSLRRAYSGSTGAASTVSASSRSTAQQAELKLSLALRDGGCIITGTSVAKQLVAAHIVPFSYGQEFLDVLIGPGRSDLYDVKMALILSTSAHKDFDDYGWSIFVQDDRFYIHSFSQYHFRYHGKEVFFRSCDVPAPHKTALRFHYTQCLMTRFRGFFIDGGDWREWLQDFTVA